MSRRYYPLPTSPPKEEDLTDFADVYPPPHPIPNVNISQPSLLQEVPVVPLENSRSKPATLIFAVVLAVVFGVQLMVPAFCCLVPGLVLAIMAHGKQNSREEQHTAKALKGVSLCCSFSALIFYISFVTMLLSVRVYFFLL